MIKESVYLPSSGYPYPSLKDNKLFVRPLTTRDYKDFIVSQGEDSVLNLIDSCLVESPIKAEDLVYQDELAVYFKIRAISLGSIIPVYSICPHCSYKNLDNIDLMSLPCSFLSLEEYPVKVFLPESKESVYLELATSKTQREARLEAQKRANTFNKKVKEFLPSFLTVSQLRVENKYNLVEKFEWYNSLPLRDAIFIDQALEKIQNFGVELTRSVTCKSCSKEYSDPFRVTSEFFRPVIGDFNGIRTEKGTLEKGITDSDQPK